MDTRVCRLYGQNDLRIENDNLAKPKNGEVLVSLAFGGICGSDIHYFSDGGIGTIRVREPIILGHEASGRIIEIGNNVQSLSVGDSVAINPSKPCGSCEYCTQDLHMHCTDMKFNGSAAHFPHEQGLFRDHIIVQENQCMRIAPDVNLSAVACAEPLAVCLHATQMAGNLEGKRVLITGAGPIGSLCAAAVAHAGASKIVVTDIQDMPLSIALKMGATKIINVSNAAHELERFTTAKGYFDVAFECSAVASAINTAIQSLKPRGTLVQVGVAGDTPMSINSLVAKELRLQGTYRFHHEFTKAVEAISSGIIDVKPVITHTIAIENANEAFRMATDRSEAIKIHLTFAST
jgi:L-idonate 5-dehydrogenase